MAKRMPSQQSIGATYQRASLIKDTMHIAILMAKRMPSQRSIGATYQRASLIKDTMHIAINGTNVNPVVG
jgi:hypothetical protein